MVICTGVLSSHRTCPPRTIPGGRPIGSRCRLRRHEDRPWRSRPCSRSRCCSVQESSWRKCSRIRRHCGIFVSGGEYHKAPVDYPVLRPGIVDEVVEGLGLQGRAFASPVCQNRQDTRRPPGRGPQYTRVCEDSRPDGQRRRSLSVLSPRRFVRTGKILGARRLKNAAYCSM